MHKKKKNRKTNRALYSDPDLGRYVKGRDGQREGGVRGKERELSYNEVTLPATV